MPSYWQIVGEQIVSFRNSAFPASDITIGTCRLLTLRPVAPQRGFAVVPGPRVRHGPRVVLRVMRHALEPCLASMSRRERCPHVVKMNRRVDRRAGAIAEVHPVELATVFARLVNDQQGPTMIPTTIVVYDSTLMHPGVPPRRRIEQIDVQREIGRTIAHELTVAATRRAVNDPAGPIEPIGDPGQMVAMARQVVSVEKVRAQGRPVWTVYADNEGHGFARKENRDYFSAATTLFFKKHLLE